MTMLALAEPNATALLLAVFGALMAFSVLFTRAFDRMGVPVVLVFLLLGMAGGSEGIGGVAFDDYGVAFRLGTVALILILLDGGLNSSAESVRRSLGPAGMLATVGVVATAGIVALIGRLLGLGWPEALLIGAIVSSTDAAAVFAILRGGRLRVADRVRSIIETESCVNDPMAVLLTVALVQSLGPDGEFKPLSLLLIPLQFAIGGVVGAAVGYATRWLLGSCRFATAGLYPVVVLASAFLAFGLATLFWGSGLLAVFVAAVILGRGPLPYRGGLIRVHDALAWMSQVGMFVMLGLLVYPSQLFPVAGIGLALGVGLACIARPLAVAACLAPFGLRGREIAYVSWVGIRGAVPIILATIPVMAGFEQGERVFHIVFFIVVVSAIVPGATILPLTRRLGFAEGENPAPAAAVEMHTLAHANADIKLYAVHPSVAAAGATLATIPFPPEAAVVLVVRGQQLLPPRGSTRIEAGDHVYVFCRPEDEPLIGLIFGAPSDG